MASVQDSVSAGDSKMFWEYINNGKSGGTIPDEMVYGSKKVETASEIAELFAEHFSSANNLGDELAVKAECEQRVTGTGGSPHIGKFEVLEAIRKLKPKKLVGEDMIPAYIVKACKEILVGPLCYIFNLSLASGIFPKAWKTANVCPRYLQERGQERDLRALAEGCGFSDEEQSILEQVILSLRDVRLKEALFAIGSLDLKLVIDRAQAAETARDHVTQLQLSSETAVALHRTDLRQASTGRYSRFADSGAPGGVKGRNRAEGGGPTMDRSWRSDRQQPSPARPCYRCTGDHGPEFCGFRTTVCRYCCKVGYIERACMSKRNRGPFQPREIQHPMDTRNENSWRSRQPSNEDSRGSRYRMAQPRDVRAEGATHNMQAAGDEWTIDIHSAKLPLLVMTGNGPSLLGRNWFPHLGITIEGIHTLHPTQIPQQLEAFRDIFTPGLGNYAGPPVQVVLKPAAKPVFRRSRPVPFALTQRVSEEIDKMVKENILMPVNYSEWATPTVNVVKGDGSIRICGDYSATVNPACMQQIFPLPTIDEMLSKLSAGSFFAKIDLSEAFLQVGVDEESSKILTLNTHKGLFHMLRLPPGLCSAPAIFQGIMETILAGLEGVLVYIDDILCHAPSKDLLWARVKSVLGRVRDAGFKLKLEKCKFDVKALDFLGYSLSEKVIQPTREKLISLLNAPSPTNVAELQGYLGNVNYYDRFFPHKATAFAPLYELLCDKEPWRWTEREEECVGDDNLEHPIAFASRVLRGSDKNYAQIDREALSIIFGQGKQISDVLSPRMLRWVLLLSNYDYKLTHRPGRQHANADFSCRFPIESADDAVTTVPKPAGILLLEQAPIGSPLTSEAIVLATSRDPVLAEVRDAILRGWNCAQLSEKV
ncbi:uncharacterized protein LOC124171170 [Ischnura elegans]|uniref:uncharacterized protein LOC124171170 n=1 Tax=Ischnura elegans TaxID=197161 RepID=UPI001ED88E46|nr:uncharacterized protein LOC124171170 [Ischnura elegans]